MAEPLKKEQPTSSVRSLLNPDRARAAIGRPTAAPQEARAEPVPPRVVPATEPSPVATGPTGEAAEHFFQVKLTQSTLEVAERLMRVYGEATGLRELNKSEFMRALLIACGNAMELHEREAGAIGTIKRPKKDPARLHIRDANEHRLAAAMAAAMRSAPAME